MRERKIRRGLGRVYQGPPVARINGGLKVARTGGFRSGNELEGIGSSYSQNQLAKDMHSSHSKSHLGLEEGKRQTATRGAMAQREDGGEEGDQFVKLVNCTTAIDRRRLRASPSELMKRIRLQGASNMASKDYARMERVGGHVLIWLWYSATH